VHQISIIPAGRAGGYTLSLPKEDRSYMSRNDMKNEIVTLLAGRVAEALIMDDISTGASNDIQRATAMARNMVTKYGMSDLLGPIQYGSESSSDEVFLGRDFNNTRNYSEGTASEIDGEIKRIIREGYAEAERLLKENMEKLHFIAGFLFKNEIMEEEQFNRAMDGDALNPVTYEELEEMVAEKRRRSAEENELRARHLAEEEKKREEERRREEQRHNTGDGNRYCTDDRPEIKH
jgi:cell division protease FtsH